jgi:hypothetical protein
MKKTTSIVTIVLLVVVGAFVVYPVWSNQVPPPVSFKPLTPQAFAGLIGWLFVVALFVERAVEVVVMIFRDQQADQLDEAEEHAVRVVKTAIKKAAALAGDNTAAPADKKATTDAVEAVRPALVTARENKLVYRAETKEIALLISFVFSVFVSLAGVRALHGLLLDATPTGNLFTVADIVVTGAMLAGGSEGIHRMANAFTSFMDGVSARGDQAQRKANEDTRVNP